MVKPCHAPEIYCSAEIKEYISYLESCQAHMCLDMSLLHTSRIRDPLTACIYIYENLGFSGISANINSTCCLNGVRFDLCL